MNSVKLSATSANRGCIAHHVSETFLTLGLDAKDPISVQNQFATLRNIHYGMRHVRNVITAGVLGAAVSGGVWAFWIGFKASAAAPSAPISVPK